MGLDGKDEWERAKIVEALDMQKDFRAEMFPYILVLNGRKSGNLEELYSDVFLPALKKYLPFYVKLLGESKSGKHIIFDRWNQEVNLTLYADHGIDFQFPCLSCISNSRVRRF